jgi:hypothetical protein
MEHKEYNGWYNYETWLVNLWLDNDEYECNEHLPEMARVAYRDATAGEYSTRDQDAAYNLAKELEDYIAEQNPLADKADLWNDLLGAALSEVNWQEIAEHLIEDLDKSEFESEEEPEAE